MFFFIVNGQHMVDGSANHTVNIFVSFVIAGSYFELFWFNFLVLTCQDMFFGAEVIQILVDGFYLLPSRAGDGAGILVIAEAELEGIGARW